MALQGLDVAMKKYLEDCCAAFMLASIMRPAVLLESLLRNGRLLLEGKSPRRVAREKGSTITPCKSC